MGLNLFYFFQTYLFFRVAVKPVVGAVDLVSQTTRGIRNTTTYFDSKSRRKRAPRYISQGIIEVKKNNLSFKHLNF